MHAAGFSHRNGKRQLYIVEGVAKLSLQLSVHAHWMIFVYLTVQQQSRNLISLHVLPDKKSTDKNI